MDSFKNAAPKGFHTMTPYLVVKDAARAIDFYSKALGAKELYRLPMPNGKIGHTEIEIGDSRFMLCDEFPEMGNKGPQSLGGTSVHFLLYVEDVDSYFSSAVREGMKVKEELEDKFWGDRMGTLEDPFGHLWSVASVKEEVSPEELKKRMDSFTEKGA